jgi:hypothetical protein
MQKPCQITLKLTPIRAPVARYQPRGDTPRQVPRYIGGQDHYRKISAPTVDAAINDLMDWAWNAVYKLLSERCLLGDGLDVEEYTGLMSWMEGFTRYTVVHSPSVAVLFEDTEPVDAKSPGCLFTHRLATAFAGAGQG